jgi:hypothetical protein
MTRRHFLVARCTSGFFVAATAASAQVPTGANLPARLTNKELSGLVAQISEQRGHLRAENLLSNETGYQYVLPKAVAGAEPGGAYIGVGLEVNFSYIAALKPSLAFVLNLRKGTVLTLWMYKALFESAPDRADFLSKLFSRPRPARLSESATAKQLFDAYEDARPDSTLFRKNLAAIKKRLTESGLALSDSDSKLIDDAYGEFFVKGPAITYESSTARGDGRIIMPSYTDLQTATDQNKRNWAYLATEATFRWIKDFQTRNLVVPIVADISGPKAMPVIAAYLKTHGIAVSALYASSIEQYLFRQPDAWRRYMKNLAALPIAPRSVVIRTVRTEAGVVLPPAVARQQKELGGRPPSTVASLREFVNAFGAGRLVRYTDVVSLSR